MLPCKVSCFRTLPLYRATTSLRKLRAAKAVVSYANYNWPGTSSLWNKTHWCATVPQKTAAVSDALREANRRDAASNEELEKKKRKEETDDLLQRLPAGRYSPAKSGKCFDTFTQCGDDLLT